jgi:acyl dehydratase/NAD(P)-dependent dehydrogenase (short-subunit alcohol dehydrogenase family)
MSSNARPEMIVHASRAFTAADQQEFARLSGDFNPMHLDVDFARRTQMGAPVVHGIHMLLWALDTALRSHAIDVQNLRARFHQPLYPGETATLVLTGRTETSLHLEVTMDGIVIAAIKVLSRPGKILGTAARSARSEVEQLKAPTNFSFAQMANLSGAVAAPAADDEPRKVFPALSQAIGTAGIRALLATSQIVGMACPGLHSLFTGLDVTRDPASEDEHALRYAVSKSDARFRSLHIDVSGSGLAGRLEAFARHAPPRQPEMTTVAARVQAGAFRGRRALIIGASRGLGEVTAKIIAAGGGHALITYRDSFAEAERVAAEIRQAGGGCDVLRYDALAAPADQLAGIGAIDSCYYFATSRIFERKLASDHSPERLRRHLAYYVDAFEALCTTLSANTSGKVSIFYPSTVAIDTEAAGIAEYAAAKAAGEALARQLNASLPPIHIVSHRLPRILTDQTATVGAAVAHDPLDVLLPIVYEVEQIGRP